MNLKINVKPINSVSTYIKVLHISIVFYPVFVSEEHGRLGRMFTGIKFHSSCKWPRMIQQQQQQWMMTTRTDVLVWPLSTVISAENEIVTRVILW